MHIPSLPICVTLGCLTAAAEAAPKANTIWYRLPAVVNDASVPWAEGKTPGGNYDGGGQDAVNSSYTTYCSPNALKPKSNDSWESQSLPIGNGRVGGTIFGGDKRDRINLNEVSLWTGGPNLPNNGSGYGYGPLADKDSFGCFQPFGNLYVDFDLSGETKEYSRSLNLQNGIFSVEFDNGGVHHTREAFVSHPDDVLVYTAKTDKPGKLSAKVGMTPCHNTSFSVSGNTIIMSGTLANGEKFEGRMMVKTTGGKQKTTGKSHDVSVTYEGKGDGMRPAFDAKGIPYFEVKNADSMEVYISLATDYKEDFKTGWIGATPDKHNIKVLKALEGKTLKGIRKAHIADHKSLFNRLSLNLGKTAPDIAALPTNVRIARYRDALADGKLNEVKKGAQGEEADKKVKAHRNAVCDPELEALVYQFGRYVLIAGSRPGNLPLNLQGIWNDKVHAAWGSDYHNNINLQMCYWGAEVGNLSECHMNFIDFMKAMEEPLHRMTQKQFGADKEGWTTRISQNPWGGGGWVKWNPPVNAWYALHVWDHYQFTQDKDYLRKTGYPLLKSICRFWETSLKEVGEDGAGLMTDNGKKPLTVADHPELKGIKAGSLVSPDGWSHEQGPVEDCCMHDQQLIWELFDNTAKAADILGVDKEWANGLLAKRDRLVGNRVADGGYLQEWVVDRPNMVTGHRHTSHLIGVYPGSTINRVKTPEFSKAAMKSLELRGLSGDNRRSWTWPWRTALWARFGEQERAYEMLQDYIGYNMLDNLFGNHPPMQMDGTFGITGGMSEMFIQSHADQIELLPALPSVWTEGSVKGICARGGIVADIEWKNGKVTKYTLTSNKQNPKPVTVVVNGKSEKVTPAAAVAAKPQN